MTWMAAHLLEVHQLNGVDERSARRHCAQCQLLFLRAMRMRCSCTDI